GSALWPRRRADGRRVGRPLVSHRSVEPGRRRLGRWRATQRLSSGIAARAGLLSVGTVRRERSIRARRLARLVIPIVIGSAILLALLATYVSPGIETGVLRATVVVLLVFIVVLVLRYMILLWLGYLHHVES